MRLFKTVILSLPLALWGVAANAGGDVGAGKTLFEADCAECHYEDDFEGESEADILAAIKGADEHKGDHIEKLDAAGMANIAAFWATAGQ